MNIFTYFAIRSPRTGRSARTRALFATAFLALFGAALVCAPRAEAQIIDFETQPSLPPQPNNFAAAGPMQTYSQAGIYSITGGVVLGNPSFLAAFSTQGSAPNAYGTADFADPSLLPAITLTLPSAENVTGISGVLFNGQSVAETYTVTYMSGANTLGVNTFTNMPSSSSTSGYGIFSLSNAAGPITQVIVTTPNTVTNGYDFFVDTLRLTTRTAVSTTPEPGTMGLLLGLGVTASGIVLRRRRARQTPTA